MRRFVKILLGLGAAAMVAVVILVCIAFGWRSEERGTHIARVEWLPAEASDVTSLKGLDSAGSPFMNAKYPKPH